MLQRNKRDVTKANGSYRSITSTTSEKGGEKVVEEVKILYSRTPITVLSNKEIRVASAVLLGEVIALSQRDGYSYATNDHYAGRLGVSPRSITDYMSELENHGYIRRVQFANSKNKTERHVYVNYEKLEAETEELRTERLKNEVSPIDVTPDFFEVQNNDATETPPTLQNINRGIEENINRGIEEVARGVEETARGIEETARGIEENDRGGAQKLLGGIENSANKDSINYSINYSINDSINNSIKDSDSEKILGFSNDSQQAETSSSKDNRPNGLSAPSVADVPVKIPTNESVGSKEPKSNYDFSFSTIKYLASRESSSYKKTANLYPNKDNIDNAVRYFAKVASVELNIPELREEIKNLPATESREFLEYLEFKVKQKRAIPIS